jgi:hypothetical protein
MQYFQHFSSRQVVGMGIAFRTSEIEVAQLLPPVRRIEDGKNYPQREQGEK